MIALLRTKLSARCLTPLALYTRTGPEDKDTIRLEFDIEGSGLEYLPGALAGPLRTPAHP